LSLPLRQKLVYSLPLITFHSGINDVPQVEELRFANQEMLHGLFTQKLPVAKYFDKRGKYMPQEGELIMRA
jgi:hypothetical protein